ncbi:MAG: GNAT family N-acetyltransferase [Lachnospiraceae bacterium]|nr:GNAT family N-acetyltransferase [Lachnospiraceae bacterium]
MITDRLEISRVTSDDKADYFYNISNDKKVLETFVCKYAESLDDYDFEPYLQMDNLFAIRLKETKKLIGIILHFAASEENACEIGYGMGSKYWNNGYATEAVAAFIEYCFSKLNVNKVYASYFTGNDASKKVMEKCGMKYDHFVEKEFEYLGRERDLTYYAIERR